MRGAWSRALRVTVTALHLELGKLNKSKIAETCTVTHHHQKSEVSVYYASSTSSER